MSVIIHWDRVKSTINHQRQATESFIWEMDSAKNNFKQSLMYQLNTKDRQSPLSILTEHATQQKDDANIQ